MELEAFSLSAGSELDDEVLILFRDVTTAVGRAALCRSRVMYELVSTLDARSAVTAHGPGHLLCDFLQLVCTADEHTTSATDTDTLVKTVKAADYFAHSEAMDVLCQHLASHFCKKRKKERRKGSHSASEDTGSQERCVSAVKVLEQIPPHISIAVLQACDSASMKDLLTKLPAAMHPLALQARYPSITTDHHLELHPCTLTSAGEGHQVLPLVFQAVSSFTALRSLSVGHIRCSDRYKGHINTVLCATFMSMLHSLTQLTMLDICCACEGDTGGSESRSLLTKQSAVHLAAALPILRNLRDLRLHGSRHEDSECTCESQELLEALQCCTNLQRLTLLHVSLATEDSPTSVVVEEESGPPDGARGCVQGDQRRAWETEEGIVTGRWAFGAALARMTGLQSLTLMRDSSNGGRQLTETEVLPMSEVLVGSSVRVLQHLTKLSLSRTSMENSGGTFRGWQHLVTIIQQLTELAHIDISSCQITYCVAQQLAPAFRSLKQLQFIDLSNNYMVCQGIDCFCEALQTHEHISHLSLSYALRMRVPWPSDAQLRATGMLLTAALSQFSKLHHLDFIGLLRFATDIAADECAQGLVAALGKHRSLQSLACECSGWRGETVHALVVALCNHSALNSLKLVADRDDEDESFAAIALSVSMLGSLTHLAIQVRANRMGVVASSAAASRAIAKSLCNLSHLQSFELRGLCFSDIEACQELACGLKELVQVTELKLIFPMKYVPASLFTAAISCLTRLIYLALGVRFLEGEVCVVGGDGRMRDIARQMATDVAALPQLSILDMSESWMLPAHAVSIVDTLVASGKNLEKCVLGLDAGCRLLSSIRRAERPDSLRQNWVYLIQSRCACPRRGIK